MQNGYEILRKKIAVLDSKLTKVTITCCSNQIPLQSKDTTDKRLNLALLSNDGRMNYTFTPMFHDRRCFFLNVLFSGGSPYPRMDGRKIASLLQSGYRMPKPQHVDDEL